jgi:restriction system protein
MLHAIRKYLHHATRAAISLIVWFILFVLLALIFGSTDGGDESTTITSPIPLFVPIVAAAGVYWYSGKLLNKSRHLYNPDLFKCQAQAYAGTFSKNHAEALRATTVASFLDAWGYAYMAHEWLQGISTKAPAQYRNIVRWQKEQLLNFQWKLRDAIERAANNTLCDLNGLYRNNRASRFEYFVEDIKSGLPRYSDETRQFVREKLQTVASKSGQTLSDELCSLFPDADSTCNSNAECYGLLDIDTMDGHDFEYWCASLLEKLGYIDVEVTRGSGDQGVDVLAKKDGIRYAIQCKRYTSDLGNTPIQEVNAGKTIYHCHVGAVITNRYFTKGAKEAAEATGVLLWDRDWITNAIEIAPH